MRLALLAVALVFTALIAGLTVREIVDYGVTWPDVLAIIVVALFATGIVGALTHRPPDR